MHAGFDAHLVGEASAPSIGPGDGLLVLSASGQTPVSTHLARLAADLGASVVAITADGASPLVQIADVVVSIEVSGSAQFGGSLFEQSALVLFDALIIELTRDDPQAHEQMRRRHTNLE